ncbi:MAG TPA: ATP-binding protein, partial [Kofleriaceae bacterium]|nr:ATP-binding protein [Kofleriaceae bacterium]
AAAVWPSSPALTMIDDFGQLVMADLADADVVLPLTGRRFAIARGAKLVLPSGVTMQLAPGSAVLAGVVMADGKTMTLVVAHGAGRQLVGVSLGTGQIILRCGLPIGPIRIATRAGIAVVVVDQRSIAAIDLRTGRELGTARLNVDIVDHAIDPDGRKLALRDTSGGIELVELPELLFPASPAAEAATPSTDEPLVETLELAVPPPVEVAPAPFRCPPLVGLEPRTRPEPIDPMRARVELERELRSVALWTLGAITEAWDSRRLGYGNEGRHPYELEVAAILGMGAGLAPEYVAAARDSLADHETAIAADPEWRGPSTPIGELMAELGLGHRAIDIVLVIAAAVLRGDTARLYGILANDPGRPLVDELLVHHVLAARHDRHDVALELDPRAPLVRLGIVQIANRRARPFAELSLDPVILDRLRAIPPDLGAATSVRRSTAELASLDIPRDVLDRTATALSRPGASRIVVRGRIGSGRRTLLATLAAEAGRDVAVIDATTLASQADAFVVEIRRALRRAHLTGLIPCIVDLAEVTFDERPGREVAAETLRAHPGPVALIASSDTAVPFPAGHVSIELPVLPETERRRVWARTTDGLARVDVDVLAARYKIGPGAIRRAVDAARDADDPMPAIEAFIRQTRDTRLGEYARRVDRLASWTSVVFPPDVLDSLRELVARVRHGRTVFETWGMSRTMATSRGLTALFQGQPGTGKTLVAGVIARELGLDLYQVDLSKVMSKWIGETERNLSTIFDAAEDGQVVLLFDEADSLFAKRTEVRSSNDRYANLEVNYLLQRLDSFEGIAILTTNIGTSIDQAFKRRMSFRLSFPFPDEDTREQLWRAHLPPELPITGPLSLDVLARKYQLSGGYIRNACLRAAFLAAQEETTLHQRHLERAVSLEFAELGKLSSGGAID